MRSFDPFRESFTFVSVVLAVLCSRLQHATMCAKRCQTQLALSHQASSCARKANMSSRFAQGRQIRLGQTPRKHTISHLSVLSAVWSEVLVRFTTKLPVLLAVHLRYQGALMRGTNTCLQFAIALFEKNHHENNSRVPRSLFALKWMKQHSKLLFWLSVCRVCRWQQDNASNMALVTLKLPSGYTIMPDELDAVSPLVCVTLRLSKYALLRSAQHTLQAHTAFTRIDALQLQLIVSSNACLPVCLPASLYLLLTLQMKGDASLQLERWDIDGRQVFFYFEEVSRISG